MDFELTINPSKSLMIYITCPHTISFVQFGESNFLRERSHGTLQTFLKNALQFKRKRVKRNPISFVLFFSNKQTIWDGGSIYIIKTPPTCCQISITCGSNTCNIICITLMLTFQHMIYGRLCTMLDFQLI